MNDINCKYIWRCANCHNHFANITKTKGLLKQEKKCPKCKACNVLTLDDKEMIVHCRFHNPDREFDSCNDDEY